MDLMDRSVHLRSAVLASIAGTGLFVLGGCGGPPPVPGAAKPVHAPAVTERERRPVEPVQPTLAQPEDSPAAIEAHPEGEAWTSIPLPDGTLFYVRYGQPGGVRIRSGPPTSRRAQAEPLSAEPGPALSPPPAHAASTPAPTEPLAAQVRRILAEELAGLPAAPRYRVGMVRPGQAPPADPLAVSPPARWAPRPDTLAALPPAEAQLIPDTLALLAPARAQSPPHVAVFLPPPPAAPAETLRLAPSVEPRTVREAFTSEGLFTSQFLLFETAKSELLPISREILSVVAEVLREFPEVRVRVEGHADPRGRADANLALSRRRAEAVRDYLVTTGGLGAQRVEAVGYGQERPVIAGSSPTALALNRRVQIRVLNPEALRRSIGDR